MDFNYVEPLVKSIENVFATMLQTQVTTQAITRDMPDRPELPKCDVSGIVGMSGDVDAALGLSFPMATAERVVSLFAGMPVETDSEDFADAIGELVNIIAGNTKAEFNGKRVSLTCPSVVLGKDHEIHSRSDTPMVCLICDSDFGVFVAEFATKELAQAAASPDVAA